MVNDGQVYLAGYVASPPSFKLSGGKPNTTVRVAVTPRYQSRETGEWSDGPTSFVNVQCWRTLATNVAMSLHKGEPVLVMGKLRVRRYPDKEGTMRTAVEVEANSIGHDLARGVTMFRRFRRPSGDLPIDGIEALLAATAGQSAGPESDEADMERLESQGEGTAGEPDPGEAGKLDVDGELDDAAVAEFERELGAPPERSAEADPAAESLAEPVG